MRSLGIASAALLLSAGVACAQSTSTPAPAPTGSPNAPQVAPGGASPGSMGPGGMGTPAAPPSGGMGSGGMGSGGMGSGGMGAPAAPPPGGAMGGTSPGMAPMPHHKHGMQPHGYSMGGPLPADASAETYLHIAKESLAHHNAMRADEALSRAETVMLNRAVPQGEVGPDSSPAVQAIEDARRALHAHDFARAAADIDKAMPPQMAQ